MNELVSALYERLVLRRPWLVLALVALARSCLVWGERLWDCTGGFEPRLRLCGVLANATAAPDCGSVFVDADSSCYASPSHLHLDLVTSGLYMRSAARVGRAVASRSWG